jgi:hypothetical protein
VFALLWGFACLDALDASGVIGFLNRYFNWQFGYKKRTCKY